MDLSMRTDLKTFMYMRARLNNQVYTLRYCIDPSIVNAELFTTPVHITLTALLPHLRA